LADTQPRVLMAQRGELRRVVRARRSSRSARRMVDGVRRRRLLVLVALTLSALGLLVVGAGVVTRAFPLPPATALATDRPTPVPRTFFFQTRWVVFGDARDPRAGPSPARLGCIPRRGMSTVQQPPDLSALGSRVVEGTPLTAQLVLSRSADEASLDCTGAARYQPLWLMPEDPAPAFAPTAMLIAGVCLLVLAGLVHPDTVRLRLRLRVRLGRRRAAAGS